jgi:predicted TIM-barrel fold metal-dependent hydrolase
MLDNGTFVIDAVAHAYNLDPSNYFIKDHAEAITEMVYGVVAGAPPGYGVPRDAFIRDWPVEDMADMLFVESDTDIAVFHPTPITAYHDGLVGVDKAAEVVKRWPDRFYAYATLDPLWPEWTYTLEQQVEMFNPIGLKLYPSSWGQKKHDYYRMDDQKVAYPLYEKCRELGIKVVAVHKAVPFGPIPIEPYRVTDIEAAAADFPDLHFEIVHGGFSFVEETAWMLARFPNVFINLEGLNVVLAQRPQRFARCVLGLATLVGDAVYDKMVWASGAMSYHPRASLEALANFQFPQAMLDEAGQIAPVSQLNDEHRRKILCDNFAAIHGIDVEARKAAIANDEFAQKREEFKNKAPYTSTSIADHMSEEIERHAAGVPA